jgi:hypothetical protein
VLRGRLAAKSPWLTPPVPIIAPAPAAPAPAPAPAPSAAAPTSAAPAPTPAVAAPSPPTPVLLKPAPVDVSCWLGLTAFLYLFFRSKAPRASAWPRRQDRLVVLAVVPPGIKSGAGTAFLRFVSILTVLPGAGLICCCEDAQLHCFSFDGCEEGHWAVAKGLVVCTWKGAFVRPVCSGVCWTISCLLWTGASVAVSDWTVSVA